jgi:hypothetical protein
MEKIENTHRRKETARGNNFHRVEHAIENHIQKGPGTLYDCQKFEAVNQEPKQLFSVHNDVFFVMERVFLKKYVRYIKCNSDREFISNLMDECKYWNVYDKERETFIRFKTKTSIEELNPYSTQRLDFGSNELKVSNYIFYGEELENVGYVKKITVYPEDVGCCEVKVQVAKCNIINELLLSCPRIEIGEDSILVDLLNISPAKVLNDNGIIYLLEPCFESDDFLHSIEECVSVGGKAAEGEEENEPSNNSLSCTMNSLGLLRDKYSKRKALTISDTDLIWRTITNLFSILKTTITKVAERFTSIGWSNENIEDTGEYDQVYAAFTAKTLLENDCNRSSKILKILDAIKSKKVKYEETIDQWNSYFEKKNSPRSILSVDQLEYCIYNFGIIEGFNKFKEYRNRNEKQSETTST